LQFGCPLALGAKKNEINAPGVGGRCRERGEHFAFSKAQLQVRGLLPLDMFARFLCVCECVLRMCVIHTLTHTPTHKRTLRSSHTAFALVVERRPLGWLPPALGVRLGVRAAAAPACDPWAERLSPPALGLALAPAADFFRAGANFSKVSGLIDLLGKRHYID
jgi:hypothetical protein